MRLRTVAITLLCVGIGLHVAAYFIHREADEPPAAAPWGITLAPEQIVEAETHGVPVMFKNDVGMLFVLIPAGTFTMGSPEDEQGRGDDEQQHVVHITKPFYMQAYEVRKRYGGEDRRPLSEVSYEQIVGSGTGDGGGFLSWINARSGGEAPPGLVYRLPTEAEWEYACRAGTTTPWSCGPELVRDAANFSRSPPLGQPAGKAPPSPQLSVGGRHAPNRWGLFDMHGNVWEWCADWYGSDYYDVSPREDPWGPMAGTARVLRGGAAGSDPFEVRSANRSWAAPDQTANKGFRLAASLPTPSPRIDSPAPSAPGAEAPRDGLTAAERFRRAIENLPPPSPEYRIDVRVELRMGGAAVGTGHLRALPGAAEDGSPVWNLTDHLDGTAVVVHISSTVDRRLAPIEGWTRLTFREDGRIVEVRWRRVPEGISITYDKDEEPALLKTTSTTLHGLTHTLLFVRLMHPEVGDFAYERFRPDTLVDPGLSFGPLQPEELKLGREAQWKRRRTWMAEALGFEAHLDRETGKLLGATVDSMMGTRLELRPMEASPKEPSDRVAYFAGQPSTPRQLVLQALVAMIQGEVATTEKLIHWPRMFKDVTGRAHEAGEDSELATFRADYLKNIAANREGRKPTELIQMAMYQMRNDLEVRKHGESAATVVLPPILKGQTYAVAKIDGRWYIVGMGG